MDMTGLPLEGLLRDGVMIRDPHGTEWEGELHRSDRADLELIWVEGRFTDPEQERRAVTRAAMARGPGVHVFLTLSVWVPDLPRYEHVWDEAVRSMQIAQYVADPTVGPRLH